MTPTRIPLENRDDIGWVLEACQDWLDEGAQMNPAHDHLKNTLAVHLQKAFEQYKLNVSNEELDKAHQRANILLNAWHNLFDLDGSLTEAQTVNNSTRQYLKSEAEKYLESIGVKREY